MKSAGSGISRFVSGLILVAAVVLLLGQAQTYNFIQDDSYITYRYARNIINGQGPVFNPGERVEGYTNFLWLMLLASLGIVGVPFTVIIPLSQIIGLGCAVATLVLFFFFIQRHSRGPAPFSFLALLLLAANGAFAYWSVSGMETGLFTLLLAGAFLSYLEPASTRNQVLTSTLLGLAGLTRPEGGLFWAVVVGHFILARLVIEKSRAFNRTNLQRLGALVLPFILLVVPHYSWRLSYYHRLFPNTFYAKTGLSLSYLKSGIEYLVTFYKAYGLWGAVLVVPLVRFIIQKRLRPDSPLFFALLVLVSHSLYTIAVGGDVLRIWRFFVPVLMLFYFFLAEGVWAWCRPRAIATLVILGLAVITFLGPFAQPLRAGTTWLRNVRGQILWNRQMENGLVAKMSATGRWLKRHLAEDEWFACTTIGAVSFYSERNMIDMLGLTDSTIALHPEDILGTRVYWKERNYNTRYLLERKPRYIYFSTGMKPSAAAERALFLRTRFRVGYFPCPVTIPEGRAWFEEVIYKAKPGAESLPLETPGVNPEFVDLYNHAFNMMRVGRDTAIATFRKCLKLAPADFAYPYEWLGQLYLEAHQPQTAIDYLKKAVALDDWCITAHLLLGTNFAREGDLAQAADHFAAVVRYAPDYYEGYANLSVVLLRLGNYPAAESVLVQAVARFPDIADAQKRLNQLRGLRPQTP